MQFPIQIPVCEFASIFMLGVFVTFLIIVLSVHTVQRKFKEAYGRQNCSFGLLYILVLKNANENLWPFRVHLSFSFTFYRASSNLRLVVVRLHQPILFINVQIIIHVPYINLSCDTFVLFQFRVLAILILKGEKIYMFQS